MQTYNLNAQSNISEIMKYSFKYTFKTMAINSLFVISAFLLFQ